MIILGELKVWYLVRIAALHWEHYLDKEEGMERGTLVADQVKMCWPIYLLVMHEKQ